MTKHVPVPYGYFKSQESRFFQAEKWAITGPDHDHEESWDIVADGIPDETTAHFIVTACNNYEQVLEALKGARGVLYKASCYLGTSFRDDAKYWHGKADAAILEAQEQIRQAEESAK
ncbi:unnamed protein product [marine sediment metagenome]|uniref:Uncharacterized protein n=1 Tax=marine sediment metagenome TaxID=412755 RepID=X0RWF9_9ZZZZ